LLIGTTLLGLLLAGVLNATTVRTYESSTELFVAATNTTDAPSAYQGSLFTQARIASYAEVLTSNQLAQRVVDDTGLPLTAGQVAGKITATPIPKTDILSVTVTDTSAERAQQIATSIGRQFPVRVAELETSDGAQGPAVEASTVEPPSYQPEPVSPATVRNLLLGAALGLLAGVALALLRERSDRSVQDEDDVRKATGAPLVSRIAENRRLAQIPVARALDQQSPVARAFRAIRVDLMGPGRGTAPRVVVVTSSLPGEGKSTVAVALAVSLARSGSRVVLVDGNLWRPRLTRYLGLDDVETGLTDVLAGRVDLRTATRASTEDRLSVLPAGPMPEDPEQELGSKAMGALLETLRASHDVVVVDAPPLLPVGDAVALGGAADGCLVVARYRKTTRAELAEATATLSAARVRVLGVVLNRVPVPSHGAAGRAGYAADASRTAAPAAAPAAGGPRTPVSDHREPRTLPAGAAVRRIEPETS
jgi:capsular exopolysaccharide synthesis family protein